MRFLFVVIIIIIILFLLYKYGVNYAEKELNPYGIENLKSGGFLEPGSVLVEEPIKSIKEIFSTKKVHFGDKYERLYDKHTGEILGEKLNII